MTHKPLLLALLLACPVYAQTITSDPLTHVLSEAPCPTCTCPTCPPPVVCPICTNTTALTLPPLNLTFSNVTATSVLATWSNQNTTASNFVCLVSGVLAPGTTS